MLKQLILIKNHWEVFTLLTLAAITVLSLWPLETLPLVPGSDKAHHLLAYSALMFPTALRRPARWQYLGLCFIAYGGVIELIQPYVNRHAEWLDMLANTIGLLIGVLIAQWVIYFFPTLKKNFSKDMAPDGERAS